MEPTLRSRTISNSARKFSARLVNLFVAASMLGTLAVQSAPPAMADPGPEKIKEAQQAVEKLQQSNARPAALADALFDLSLAYLMVNDFAHGEEYLRKSLDIERGLKRNEQFLKRLTRLGGVLLSEGKPQEAIVVYNEAIDAAARADMPNDVMVLKTNIASALRVQGKTAEAEKYLVDMIAGSKPEWHSGRSTAMRSLAGIYQQQGKINQAMTVARQLIESSAKVDETAEALGICLLGQLQESAGDSNAALATFNDLVRRFGGADKSDLFPDILANAYLGIADISYHRQLTREASAAYEKARAAAELDGSSPDVLAQALTGLGSTCADAENFADAQKYHRKALEIALWQGSPERATEAELQLAEDYQIQGSPEKALDVLRKAAKRFDKPGCNLKLRADLNVALGKCYKQLGQKEPAIHLIQEAIKQYRQTDNPVYEALATNTLATVYLDFNELDKLDGLKADMERLRGSMEDPRDRARFQYNQAQAALMRGKSTEAIPMFQEALKAISNTGDVGLESAMNRGLGLAYFLSGQYEPALNCYDTALKLLPSGDKASLDAVWSCNLGIGKCLRAMQRYDEAVPPLLKACDKVEEERRALTRDAFKTHNLDFRRDCFYELVDVYTLKKEPVKALQIAERGKARAFLDMMQNRGGGRRFESISLSGNAGSGGADQSRLASLVAGEDGSRSISVVGRNNTSAGNSTTGDASGRSVSVSGTDQNGRSITVTGTAPDEPVAEDETAISEINAEAPSAEKIIELVKRSGTTCLEYLRIRDKLYVWVIHPDGQAEQLQPIAEGNEALKLVTQISANITRSAATPADLAAMNLNRQQKLQRLYQILIKPVEKYLPADKEAVVTIVPDDYLFRVPFAALVDGDGKFFIEKHTLSYAPAVGVLEATQKLAQETSSAPHKLLAFGNPITRQIAFLGALPYAEKEVRAIEELYGPGNSKCEYGERANKAAFEQFASNYTEIHLATHGLVDEEKPMRSALVLAPQGKDDGLLTVRDILALKNLKARLVVLSACETGKGLITGDGVVGLSRAFIIAGTPSVLVSQWNVDDVMTKIQMQKFYGAFLKGKDKAHALRDAQLATIAFMENGNTPSATKARANPRYWAAFQLIGDSR